jgi:osmotically-inducible protein OsmY
MFCQQATNQSQSPPAAGQQVSPDQQQPKQPESNPQDKASFNSQVRDNIRSVLSADPILSGTDVEVNVDDVNITLTGSVQSQGQMARVMALVSPYTQYRNVVNKVVVR